MPVQTRNRALLLDRRRGLPARHRPRGRLEADARRPPRRAHRRRARRRPATRSPCRATARRPSPGSDRDGRAHRHRRHPRGPRRPRTPGRTSSEALAIRVTGEEVVHVTVRRDRLGSTPRAAHTIIDVAPFARAVVVLDNAGEAELAENVEILVGDSRRADRRHGAGLGRRRQARREPLRAASGATPGSSTSSSRSAASVVRVNPVGAPSPGPAPTASCSASTSPTPASTSRARSSCSTRPTTPRAGSSTAAPSRATARTRSGSATC